MERTALAIALADRAALLCLFDALPTQEKIAAEQRLLALVTNRSPIPGVNPGTTIATEVRTELDALIRALQRSALQSLSE